MLREVGSSLTSRPPTVRWVQSLVPPVLPHLLAEWQGSTVVYWGQSGNCPLELGGPPYAATLSHPSVKELSHPLIRVPDDFGRSSGITCGHRDARMPHGSADDRNVHSQPESPGRVRVSQPMRGYMPHSSSLCGTTQLTVVVPGINRAVHGAGKHEHAIPR